MYIVHLSTRYNFESGCAFAISIILILEKVHENWIFKLRKVFGFRDKIEKKCQFHFRSFAYFLIKSQCNMNKPQSFNNFINFWKKNQVFDFPDKKYLLIVEYILAKIFLTLLKLTPSIPNSFPEKWLALKNLYNKMIVQRDLKPENLFLF